MSEKLKIVYRPLQELSPYAHNARTHSTEQVAQLVESIKQFGWTNPVLIDEKGEIIAGHGRVMAAEMLKMDSVPVIVLSGLTDEQKKAYRLADTGKCYLVIAGRGISEVERHSLGEGYGSRKTVPDPGGGRNKKQPDAGSQ